MKIYGTIEKEVYIDPLTVIKKLIIEFTGIDGRIKHINNKYFIVKESIGMPEDKEISKEDYAYYISLKNIERVLNERKQAKIRESHLKFLSNQV